MRYLLVLVLAAGLAGVAHAQSASCTAAAAEKKLAGAALASFMKKCESDAAAACNSSAGEKKLSGAAKTSFTTKCVRDKVGK
ncbi:MAG TPA: hypothetical protein VH913_23105 [Hyphomicrobiaceae bacterium]|jgi:hypothetical protein